MNYEEGIKYSHRDNICFEKGTENLLGTNGPIGFDPGGHDFKHPRTPLQSAP